MINQLPMITEALGAMLLHSIWQGATIAIVLFLLLRVGAKSPQSKYLLACAALLALVGWMGITFAANIETPDGVMGAENPALVLEKGMYMLETIALSPDWQEYMRASFQTFLDLYASKLVLLWLVGAAFFGVRWTGGLYYTQHLKRRHSRPLPLKWQEKTKQLSYGLGIARAVRVIESAKADVPMVIGYLKPVILIPSAALTGFSPSQLEAVIVHELAHIKNHDFLVNLILSALEIVLFYHPAYWYFRRIITQERENRCDDWAVAHTGNPRLYAETLFNMEKIRQQRSLAMALQGKKNQLLERIKRICAPSPSHRAPRGGQAFIAFGCLLAIGVVSLFQMPATATAGITNTIEGEIREVFNLPPPPPIDEQTVPPVAEFPEGGEGTETETAPIDDKNEVLFPEREEIRGEDLEMSHFPEPLESVKANPFPLKTVGLDSLEPKAYKTVVSTVNKRGDTELVFHNSEGIPYRKIFIKKNKARIKLNGKEIPEGNQTYYLKKGDTFDIRGTVEISDMEGEDPDYSEERDLFIEEDEMRLALAEERRLFEEGREREMEELLEKREHKRERLELEREEHERLRGQHERLRKEHREQMERHREEMDKHRAKIEEHRELIKKEQEEIRERMGQSRAFQHLLTKELQADGLISNPDKFRFHLSEKEMRVNGKRQPEDIHQKYLDLYRAASEGKVGTFELKMD